MNRVVVPHVSHITAENLVTGAGEKEQTVKHTTYNAVVEDLSSSSTSSSSSDDDIEQYEKEPGVRQDASRSFGDDLDEYNEEPVPRDQQQGTRSKDQASRKVDSGFPDKKVGKKGPRLEISGENRSRTFADHLQNSPGLSEDVWKEAMAGVPLASSESFDMHLLKTGKDQAASLDDDDGDAFERRGRRKGKSARSNDRVNDLKWTEDLPINDSLSRETLDDISCDSYVPPEPSTGWDVDSLEVDLDDFMEEGTAKVLDILAQSSDSAQGRVVGRRKERVDREDQRKKTLSTSFETNVDEIEFDTVPRGNVSDINRKKQPEGNVPDSKVKGPPEEDTAGVGTSQNVSNINKTKQSQTGKDNDKRSRRKGNVPVSNINKVNETAEDAASKEQEKQLKQPTKDKMEPEEEEVSKDKSKKRRQPVSNFSQKRSDTIPVPGNEQEPTKDKLKPEEEDVSKGKAKKRGQPVSNFSQKKSATIPIMSADAAAGSFPFEEDEVLYSDEPSQDLSANINIRLWRGPTTNIDDDDDDDEDDDLLNEGRRDGLTSNLHDQRLDEEEDSNELSTDEKPMSVKPPAPQVPQRNLLPVPNTSQSTSRKAEVLDRLPERPRRSQPTADGDLQSSRQRRPPARTTAQRPYNGIFTFIIPYLFHLVSNSSSLTHALSQLLFIWLIFSHLIRSMPGSQKFFIGKTLECWSVISTSWLPFQTVKLQRYQSCEC